MSNGQVHIINSLYLKHFIILCFFSILLCSGCSNKNESSSLPNIVMLNGEQYGIKRVSAFDYDISEYEFVSSIESTIEVGKAPVKNFESNFLPVGTNIYKNKGNDAERYPYIAQYVEKYTQYTFCYLCGKEWAKSWDLPEWPEDYAYAIYEGPVPLPTNPPGSRSSNVIRIDGNLYSIIETNSENVFISEDGFVAVTTSAVSANGTAKNDLQSRLPIGTLIYRNEKESEIYPYVLVTMNLSENRLQYFLCTKMRDTSERC